MIKKSAIFSFKIFVEIGLGLAVIILIAAAIFAGFLVRGPIDMMRVLPTVERQINAQLTSDKVTIGSLNLEWQADNNLLGLNASNVILSNMRGPFLYAPEIDLNISIRSLLLGRFRIEDVWIRNVALAITRASDGQVRISGHDSSKDIESLRNEAIPAVVTLNDLIHDLPSLDSLWIDRARIIYRDEQAQTVSTYNPVTVYIAMHEDSDARNLSGFARFPLDADNPAEQIRVDFTTKSDPLALHLNADLRQVESTHLLQFTPDVAKHMTVDMVVNGSVQAQMDNLWNMQNLQIDLSTPKGRVVFENNGEREQLDISDLELLISTDLNTDTAHFRQAKVTINDLSTIELGGTIENVSSPAIMRGAVTLTADRIPHQWVSDYWPETEQDNGAYEWIVTKTGDGVFKDLSIALDFDKAIKARTDDLDLPPWMKDITATFGFEGMRVDYHPPLILARDVDGTGKYETISLSLDIENAKIGDLDIRGATLYFDDLITSGAGNATLKFPITGDVQSVFDYIATDPINAFDTVDFNPKAAKGQADLVADIKFPLAKDTSIEAFDVVVAGTLNDVIVENVIKNLTLSGGPYALRATTGDVALKGAGQLAGQPVDLDWHEYFSAKPDADYLSKATVKVTADNQIRKAFMKDFSRYFSGLSDVDLVYVADKNGKDSHVDLAVDLQRTGLSAESLGLKKEIGRPAKATLGVYLRNGDLAKIANLKITGNGLSLANGEIDFTTDNGEPLIHRGALQNLIFGENKLSLDLGGDKDLLKITAKGPILDARPILAGEKDAGDPSAQSLRGMEIGLDVLEMQTSDTMTLKDAEVYIRQNKTGQMERFELNAKAGKSDLYVRYTPDNMGKLSLQVEASDAGDTLRAFDLYSSIEGGTLRIAGVPLSGGRFGDVSGKVRIDNFEVRKAPVLIRLLNALSFQGGDKLNFTRLESDFEWRIGDAGDTYTIRDGRTSGASVGFTFDGYVDTGKKEMDIRGTAAPLSMLNSMVGNIPIIGSILTGGGALVAATYSITGATDDPKIGVNPLSVLTPGIIRKLLFEGASDPTPQADSNAPAGVRNNEAESVN